MRLGTRYGNNLRSPIISSMQPKKQLITLEQDGELALKSPDGSIQALPKWDIRSAESLVYLLIDCSGSMAGNKLTRAKNGALDFAETAFNDGYAVGLISFSDDVSHLCSPISKIQDLSAAVNSLQIQGGTNLTPAIEEVVERFEGKSGALRAMVIVTDGLTSNPQDALNAADRAKQLGISILTIGTNDADFDFLSQLASDTELAKQVSDDYLEEAISSAAKMLPRGE